MDVRAYHLQLQAAEAAKPDDAEHDDEPEPTPKDLLLVPEVQGTADAPASRQGSGVAPMGVGNAEASKAAKGDRDLTCPECGKTFPSDKAMYGHLRKHPDRGYKGATRPTATSAAPTVAGDKKPKEPRKEADVTAMNMTAAAATVGEKKPWEEAELSTKWPVKAKRGRAPSTPGAGSAPVAANLASSCSEEEEAAMILLEMASGRSTSETQQPKELVHAPDAVSGHQMPDVEQPVLLDHVAGNQTPEAEQIVRLEPVLEVSVESQTPEVNQLAKLELATPAVVVVNVGLPANMPIAPSTGSGAGAKKAKKRRFLDLVQTQVNAPPEGADVKPPARRIPSPASDKKHECPICFKLFPTYQALGGHMSSHVKGKISARADDLAVAQAKHNILAHRNQSGSIITASGPGAGAGQERQDVEQPAPTMAQTVAPHVCPECHLTFPSGQALGGHKRKHWFAEKQQARAAGPAAAARDFDLNELPKEGEGENQHS